MILLNPRRHVRKYADEKSRQIMLKTVEFFEKKGLRRIKQDWHQKTWNNDFVDFLKENQVFATLMTPSGYGAKDSRWDNSSWKAAGSSRWRTTLWMRSSTGWCETSRSMP